MAISGIGSNNFFDYTSSVNQVKLQQALNKAGSKYVSNKEETYNKSTDLEDSMKFLKSYSSEMSDMMTSANRLKSSNTSSVWNDVAVSSSNKDVLSASESYNLKGSSGNSYEVNVKQLATAQTNVSSEFVNTDKAASAVSLDISSSGKNISVNVSNIDANGNLKTNKQLLQDVAKEINSKKTDVKATLVESNGKTSIKLTGNTGKDNTFSVSGSFADTSGLANTSQTSQDAQYSVKSNDGVEKDYTSSSNKISLEYGKIAVELKKSGTSTVSVGSDNSKVISAVEDLVKDYNSSLKLLNDNAERGTGVTRQLKNLLTGISSEKSMDLVGISVNKDGTLALDKTKLETSLNKDPSLTKDIIGGSFGIAQRTFQKASNGLSTTSSSLVNNDIKNARLEAINDPINSMNMFSRSGAYNMMNYSAVGIMLNMYA